MFGLRKYFRSILYAAVVLSVCLSVTAAPNKETPESYSSDDTIFNEIVLDEDGVTAVDVDGNDWYYDFERATFVLGQPPSNAGTVYSPVSDVPIEQRATIEKKVKRFETGDVTVREDEYVDGDIMAWGTITVKGWVKGDVVSAHDRVLVTETAYIEGNVRAQRVVVKEGAVVDGSINESDNPMPEGDFPVGFKHTFLLVMTIITMSFIFFGFIILTVMPKQTANIENCIAQNKSRCALLGFLIVLVLPAIVVLLAITIVGAVLIPILPMVYAFAILLGIIATGRLLGVYVCQKYLQKKCNQIMVGMIGIIVLMAPWLATGALMDSPNETTVDLGVFFLVVSITISLFPIMAGLGASFLTRFGFKTYVTGSPFGGGPRRPATPSPAPPPIPDAPFGQKPETPDSGSRISEENKDS